MDSANLNNEGTPSEDDESFDLSGSSGVSGTGMCDPLSIASKNILKRNSVKKLLSMT